MASGRRVVRVEVIPSGCVLDIRRDSRMVQVKPVLLQVLGDDGYIALGCEN